MNYSSSSKTDNKFNLSSEYRIVRDGDGGVQKDRSFLLYFSVVVVAFLALSFGYIQTNNINVRDYVEKLTANTDVINSESLSVLSTDKSLKKTSTDNANSTNSTKTIETDIVLPEQEAYDTASKTTETIEQYTQDEIQAIEFALSEDSLKAIKADKLSASPSASPSTNKATEKSTSTDNPSTDKVSNNTPSNISNKVTKNSVSKKQKASSKVVTVRKGDSLSIIFQRLSISSKTLLKVLASGKSSKYLKRLQPGQKIVIGFDKENSMQSLHYDINKLESLIIKKKRDSDKFTAQIKAKKLEVRKQYAIGIITSSFYQDGKKAGLSDRMVTKLSKIFGWDIDFSLDIHKGDSFTVLFEEKYIANEKVANGHILFAEFINKGKSFTAVRYTDKNEHTDYYTIDGRGMRKPFLRSPVAYSRISSGFKKARKHPILNKIRSHKGVDYAAPRGTPIKSVGRGEVVFKGRKGGYGRVIVIQHGDKYSTLYAHMNSYNKKIKKGSHVRQGQVIGYVGSSGLATGSHLHYEFRINGVHRNPLTVPLPNDLSIERRDRHNFRATRDTLLSLLKLRKNEAVASLENKKDRI